MRKILEILKNDLADTHCHLVADELLEHSDGYISDAEEAGIKTIISMSVDVASSRKVIEHAAKRSSVLAAIGLDPELLIPTSTMYIGDHSDKEFENWVEECRNDLLGMIKQGGIAIIGECGMDSFRMHQQLKAGELDRDRFDLSLKRQERLFRMQCELAQEHTLPLSIHSRNMERFVLNVVEKYNVEAIFHSFTGGYKVAKRIVDSGHFLGMNGIVTYPSAGELRQMYSKILGPIGDFSPSDFYTKGVVFETDAPWLHPFNPQELNTPKEVSTVFKFAINSGFSAL